MDIRAEKLAKARKKLKDHQEKKTLPNQKSERGDQLLENVKQESLNNNINTADTIVTNIEYQHSPINGNTIELQTNQDSPKSDINFTELLISNKTNLEMQINDLNGKLAQLEYQLGLEVCNHNVSKQNIVALQSEVNDLRNKYSSALQETTVKDDDILRLNNTNKTLQDDNTNLSEQLEFTKSILSTKEFETAQLQNQIFSYQSQLDQLQVQLQQLTNNSTVTLDQDSRNMQEMNASLQKIPYLEQKIEALQKEKDHIQSHYEHYLQELNKQVQSEIMKNENLNINLQELYNRENSFIEQISDMEIRLQNYDVKNKTVVTQTVDVDSEKKFMELKNQLAENHNKYEELQKRYMESLNKIQVLTQEIEKGSHGENTCNHDIVDIGKLTADMASDKLAAQRATEQNNKLKADIEQLEQVIVKMGKDKLELTEKWTHENQLSKGLSLKLADIEDNTKNMHKQLKAKDDEMIRLQGEYRELEHKYEKLVQEINQVSETEVHSDTECNHNTIIKNNENDTQHIDENCQHVETVPMISETVCQKMKKDALNDTRIRKEDAMVKLQERFLNIMDEVANLSDEKHRLEHIILQLQTETDTICEYVALYQQQRSLLKRREEERSNQLQIFQKECDKLKRQLEELSDLLLRIAADEQLASLLKEESRHNDLVRVKELLQKLQNCSLINPKFKNLDLNVFYPCSCCSGQLIDI